MKIFCCFFLFTATVGILLADPVHVLVWDERQPRQSEAYDNFLGNEIAQRLAAKGSELELRSVALDDPEQGLIEADLKWADVLIWWGHARHSDLTIENSMRVLDRVLTGELDLITLHSAHWSRPFVAAMNWRTEQDAREQFAQSHPDQTGVFTFIDPPKERTVPLHGSVITPAYFAWKKNKKNYDVAVHLPWCCFPDYRPDGKSGTLKLMSADHPIAAGLPATLIVPQTEMYNEPFHVPAPDEVIFEETWELGERFRSGMIWEIGQGKVFYFRPGHETYPIFKQPEIIQILANASLWLGQD